MYAQITLVGHVGQEPELRYTPNGTPTCNFTIAINRIWTNGDGERQESTTWYRIQCWRRQAETCSQYIKKGDLLLVAGDNIESSGWLDRDGNVQSNIQVTPRVVRFLTSKAGRKEDIVADTSSESAVEANNPFVQS